MRVSQKPFTSIGVVLLLAFVLAACSKSSSNSPGTTGPSSGGAVPQISVGDFTADFSLMKQLTGLASQGKGSIGVLLPDTTTSTRYVQYDAPYLTKAFIDSSSGAAIASKAESQGVKVIDYDRLNTGGPADRFYVSFDNVTVGKTMGDGFVDCVTAWKLQKPNVLIMDGDPTDNNAKLFAQGYNGVLQPLFDNGSYVKVGEPPGTWTPSIAATIFQQQYTAHPNINSAITANDDKANAVIAILKSNNIPATTFPTTGQDASLPGLQNILTGYQCGTVYKPVYLEAQAAAALAIYLRAGATPPTTLVTSTTQDSVLNKAIPSVYTTPIWVTTSNMEATVIKDGAVKTSDLCAGNVATACQKYGIG